jgi:acyl-CoA thioester hydrolase
MKKLTTEIKIKVRFSETDAMGVIWHGNYLKFFEDARESFGIEHKLEYLDMYYNGFFTPIIKSNIDHKSTVKYGEELMVIITHEPSKAAKIIFTYKVTNVTTGKLAAIGSTTQVFLHTTENQLSLNKPDFFSKWENDNSIQC